MSIESEVLKKLQDLANRENRHRLLGDVVSVETETCNDSRLADRLKLKVMDNTAVQTENPRNENGDLITDAYLKVNRFRREISSTKNGEIADGRIDMGNDDVYQTIIVDDVSIPKVKQLKF